MGIVALMDAGSWFASLPTMYGSAAALITDTDGPSARVLLVKPNYRAGWSLPGGILEQGEPPHVGLLPRGRGGTWPGAAHRAAADRGLDGSGR